MTGMLELSEHGLKTTVINMLRGLIDKADNMQEQVDNGGRDGNSKNEKEMLEIKKKH